MMHLSRFSEELINWNSTAWQFVDLPDKFCTGSSIMPRKIPTCLNLSAANQVACSSHLMSLLTLMKGQPLAYNKDNQEDKEPLYDAADTLTRFALCRYDAVITGQSRHFERRASGFQQPQIWLIIWSVRAYRSVMPMKPSEQAVALVSKPSAISQKWISQNSKYSVI